MNNTNKQTQTIDLQPLFTTLKECGFTDMIETDNSLQAIYPFYYRKLIYFNAVSVDIRMLYTKPDIIIEVNIAGKLCHVESVEALNPAMLTKRDILRLIEKTVSKFLQNTTNNITRELSLIRNK